MNINLTEIILAVITLIGAILTTFVLPVLKNKLTAQQQEKLNMAIRIGVFAAEQLFAHGDEKKKYVQNLLSDKGYDVNLIEIDAAIEAMVRELKMQTEK